MRFVFCIVSAFWLSGCYTAPDLAPRPEISGNYVLDPEHSSVIWSVSHVGLSNFTGRFDQIEGQLEFNSENPEQSKIFIQIDPTSVSTGLPDFDKTIGLKSDYFNGDEYPAIVFVSDSISITGENTGQISGDLQFRGRSHLFVLDVTYNGAGKSFGHPGETLGFSATGQLNRSDWGLTTLKNFGIGELVTLRIETEFNEAR